MEKQLNKRSSKTFSKTTKVETPKEHLVAELRENRKKTKWKKDEVEHWNEDADSCDKSKDEDLSSEGNCGSDISDDEFTKQEEMKKLRQELADLSFEELQKLKEKVGIKQFNEIFHGASIKKKKSDNVKKSFQRENKNRPMEMSSKRPVSRFKPVVPVKKEVQRDPRFDDLSGAYNETIFHQTYGFLTDIKQREKQKLLKQLKKERDPEKRRKLQSLTVRLKQQEQAEVQKRAKKERDKKLRTDEKEMVQQGKKPFYWKKSEKRKLELAEKFRELKKSGKIESYLGKKRKRIAAKERKNLPNKSLV